MPHVHECRKIQADWDRKTNSLSLIYPKEVRCIKSVPLHQDILLLRLEETFCDSKIHLLSKRKFHYMRLHLEDHNSYQILPMILLHRLLPLNTIFSPLHYSRFYLMLSDNLCLRLEQQHLPFLSTYIRHGLHDQLLRPAQ